MEARIATTRRELDSAGQGDLALVCRPLILASRMSSLTALYGTPVGSQPERPNAQPSAENSNATQKALWNQALIGGGDGKPVILDRSEMLFLQKGTRANLPKIAPR